VSDGSGTRTADLTLDTKLPTSLDRHVSFASPPVDTTIPAASYPSSPESLRSPPSHFAQPSTPNYRTAFLSDPFENVGRDAKQDNTIEEALGNAQNNALIGQSRATRSEEMAVRDTLSRFAAAPRLAQQPAEAPAVQAPPTIRQSLDVDAFKRLLLTGDSGRSNPETANPPTAKYNLPMLNDSSSGTDTTSLSQASIYDIPGFPAGSHDDTPRSSHEQDRDIDNKPKVAPPAPAPRRGKSVKVKPPSLVPGTELSLPGGSSGAQTLNQEKPTKKPPAPPLARRQSHRTSSGKSEESIVPLSEASSPTDSIRTNNKAPPPPPIRRQQPMSQRSTSNDLAPTIEEPEIEPVPSNSSRRSSNDRPCRMNASA